MGGSELHDLIALCVLPEAKPEEAKPVVDAAVEAKPVVEGSVGSQCLNAAEVVALFPNMVCDDDMIPSSPASPYSEEVAVVNFTCRCSLCMPAPHIPSAVPGQQRLQTVGIESKPANEADPESKPTRRLRTKQCISGAAAIPPKFIKKQAKTKRKAKVKFQARLNRQICRPIKVIVRRTAGKNKPLEAYILQSTLDQRFVASQNIVQSADYLEHVEMLAVEIREGRVNTILEARTWLVSVA